MLRLLALLACSAPPAEPTPPPPDPSALAAVLGRVLAGRATDADLATWEAELKQRGPNAGPQHEQLLRTWTADGLTLTAEAPVVLREHAAVPDVVRGPDGAVRLFYVEGDHARGRAVARDRSPWAAAHGLVGWGAIDQLVSRDGLHFEIERGFGVLGLVQGMVVDPCVRALPDGTWRLWYVGVPVDHLVADAAWADGADHVVYTAVSADLVRFRQEGPAVTGPNADPAVWCEPSATATSGRCLMLSTGLDRSVSTDGGRSFRFEGSFGVDGFAPTFVDLPDGRVRLYYNAKERGGPLRSMISADQARTWAAEPGDRAPPYTLEAPSLLPRAEGGWWIYAHYWREGLSGDSWSNSYRYEPAAPRRGPGGTILPEPPGGWPAPKAP